MNGNVCQGHKLSKVEPDISSRRAAVTTGTKTETPTLEALLRASIPAVAKLEQAMKAAIAAAAGAEQFGHEIG